MTTLERSAIPVEDHLRAWFMSSVRLDLHLEATHGVVAPSNRADWATLHALRHETYQDHSLETVKPCPCEFDQWPPYTLEWHRKHKVHHLATFPALADDKPTVHALDQAIRQGGS